jgi:DNA-binding beta-propeller fold protein YncE
MKGTTHTAVRVLVVVGLGFLIWRAVAMVYGQRNVEDQARVRAPEFAGVDKWLNTDRPLRLAELRGQVVLLDFWTYCCINCMHVLPELKYLEDKYRDQPFVVIGVHSGKFSAEKDPDRIRQAILRHNVAHPVAVDNDYAVWNAYGVRAWPTLVLIDPEGYVVGRVSGEGHREALDRKIGELLETHRAEGKLAKPLRFRGERESFQPGVLQFPGKVLADGRDRLFISDTNHHRVLIADSQGRVQSVVGDGKAGLRDGRFEEARFHQPQGLALSADGQTLYVADTENHALRAVDLAARTVRRIAGTGEPSYDYAADGPARETPLSSPWDLARVDDQLYVALAGTHQVGVMDLSTQRVRVFAGTGREGRLDGPRVSAAFAQPSGLASDGRRLYVADSEVSTIRAIELGPEGQVGTVAGSGGLFDFGTQDGIGAAARFQHPLGVVLWGDQLFVADTFNNAVRRIDLTTAEVTTWLGTGQPESGTSAEIGFSEPGGVSVAGDTLYVADTNRHRIVAVEIKTRQARILDVGLPPAP